MSLLDRLPFRRRRESSTEIERHTSWVPEWPDSRFPGFGLGGLLPYGGFTMSPTPQELVEDTFVGYVQGAYRANGVIFAVSEARRLLFSEAVFKFRRRGTVGGGNDLFGTPELAVLERPWPGGTTQDLLSRMIQDADMAGTAFVAREGDRLRRLRPDWVEFVLSAPPADAAAVDIVGFKYTVGGPGASGEIQLYTLDEVAFWAPTPDPSAMFRGMSWLTPVIRELQADLAATTHKLKFFENAATPNLAVALKETVTEDAFRTFVSAMNDTHKGAHNAYKTLYLGGGADVTVIGADLQKLDFRAVQGAGETRIAAAGRVPPIVVGLSEGLAAATYSNYGQAKRAFGDSWARPTWRSACGALEQIIAVPGGSELWYDDRDIAFLREDRKDFADIQATEAATVASLITAGYVPDSVVSAVQAEDWSMLKHSGMFSVQLQPPPDPNAPDPNAPLPVDGVAPADGTDPAIAAADAEAMPG